MILFQKLSLGVWRPPGAVPLFTSGVTPLALVFSIVEPYDTMICTEKTVMQAASLSSR